ncbi:ABC transporter substrate-binding protein [Microbacterium gorillae]|uniref:ABC transporter substrate-binding protein n=1 Tax=Microbacterium gorillae TaxID=1231063 RepID=UPI0005900EF8|nr:ABC transporter substrate-binding protein [Microbacterium gorillae]
MSALSRHLRRGLVVAGLAVSLIGLSACAGGSDTGSSAAPGATTDGALQTITPGKLTIATGQPAYSPWVIGDKPESGEGLEAAVSYALAEKLGFAKDDVVWVRTTFDAAIAPGPKDWDLNIQQFSATDERRQAVDFSTPYYTTSQAVVAKDATTAAKVSTIADLKKATVGAMVGTTSYTVLKDATGVDPQVFNSNADLVAALQSGQIDALVVDLPTAFYVTGAQVEGSVIVGQFADTTGGDELSYVLPKDSALTAPVSAALDALRADGTLDKLAEKWITSQADVPVLK